MKSRFITLFLLLTIMAVAAPQVSALDIRVLPGGRIEFYSGSVLGDDDERKEKEEKREDEKKEEKREDKREDKREEKREDEKREDRREERREEPKIENRIRTVNQGERQELRVRTEEDEVKVELRKKPFTRSSSDEIRFESKEEIKSDDVHLQFPTHYSRDQFQAAKEKQELVREALKDEAEDRFGDDEERREAFKTRIEEEQAEYQRYWEQLREERQQREEEVLELKNKLKDREQTLELRSRNVKAALEQGAEFGLDPTTNEVTVVTPSGQEHTLNHLPDQAIERMKAVGFFTSEDNLAEEEVEVETNEQGELVYTKKDQIRKRLFGLFPRQVDSEIVLNDTTGEVVEYEAAPSSIFEQFLNAVSF